MTCKIKQISTSLIVSFLTVITASVNIYAADVVTLEKAIAIALKKNPSLVASQSDVDAAQARVTQAASSYYPQVNASAGYDHSRTDVNSGLGKSSNLDNYSAGFSISQYVYDFGKTPAQVKKSGQNLESTKNNLKTTEKTLVRDVKQSYFEALKNQQLVNVRQEALDVRKKHLEQSRALYREGMRPKIDTTRGEVEVSQAQLRLVVARYGLQRSMIALEKLLGGPPNHR